MLDIICTTLLPDFYPLNLQDPSFLHVFTSIVGKSVDPDQLEEKTFLCAVILNQS